MLDILQKLIQEGQKVLETKFEQDDGITLTNGNGSNSLPKYWTTIQTSFDDKKEAVNV